MLNLNNVNLAGNLTRDPQVRFFENEKCVADFGLAINRRYRDKGGEMKEETTFVDVEVWGRQAELCGQYLTKGRNCMIEGSLKLDQWEDKASGAKRSKLKVVAQRVHFIGGNEGQQGQSNQSAPARDQQQQTQGDTQSAPVAPSHPDESDLPF